MKPPVFPRQRLGSALVLVALLTAAAPAAAMDLSALWDFKQPGLSEQRFRAALATARGDDALVLQTQLARTYGLRGDFATAQALLKPVAAQLATAGPEAQVYYALELGRTYASAAHRPELQTAAAREQARACYERALDVAKRAHLDGLAIDAIHMLAFVDTAPQDQLRWGQEALAVVEASSQLEAKRWEASVRNNVGYALHQLGRYDEALLQFRRAVVLREREGGEPLRVAHWMVAWTLRALGRSDEALDIQRRLERECDAAGAPDRYVYEELELLFRARGDEAQARHYARLKDTVPE